MNIKNAVDEVEELAIYLKGMADGSQNEKLLEASKWLEKLSGHMCGEGYIGCDGGRDCNSDHK